MKLRTTVELRIQSEMASLASVAMRRNLSDAAVRRMPVLATTSSLPQIGFATFTPKEPVRKSRGTQAVIPTYTASLSPRQRVEAKIADAMQRSPSTLGASEINALVEEAVMLGMLPRLVTFLTALSDVAATSEPASIPSVALAKVLTAASLRQAVDLGDDILRIAFVDPRTRLTSAMVETYCSLLAGLPKPDHSRAITLATAVKPFGLKTLAPYLSALARIRGGEAVKSALIDMLAWSSSPGITPELAIEALDTLVAVGSQHVPLGFQLAMTTAAAASGCSPEQIVVTTEPDGLSIPWVTVECTARGAQVAAVNLAIPGLMHLERHAEAVRLLRAAVAANAASPETAARATRRIISVLSGGHGRAASSLAAPKRGAGGGGDALDAPTRTLVSDLMPVLQFLGEAGELRPGLSLEVLRRLLALGCLPEAIAVVNWQMASEGGRSQLSTAHINTVVAAMLDHGYEGQAGLTFERMLGFDTARFPRLAPDAVTFNAFLSRAAKAGDAREVRRLLGLMRSHGVKPDGITLLAVTNLRQAQAAAAADMGEGGAGEADALEQEARAELGAGEDAGEAGGEASARPLSSRGAAYRARVLGGLDVNLARLREAARNAQGKTLYGRRLPHAGASALAEAADASGGEAQAQGSGGEDDWDGAAATTTPAAWGDDATAARLAAQPGSPFNSLMQAYFAAGAPARGVEGVLDAMASAGVPPAPDTVRNLLVGAAVSGLQGDAGAMARVPLAWGGTLPQEEYDAQRSGLRDARARLRDGKRVGDAEWGLVRAMAAPGVGPLLAQYRVALAVGADLTRGTGGEVAWERGAAGLPLAPAVVAAAPWLATPIGQLLASHLALFTPLPSSPAGRMERVEKLREAAGLAPSPPRGGSGPLTAVEACTSYVRDMVNHRELCVDAEAAAAVLPQQQLGAASASAAADPDDDVLLRLPGLLQRLFASHVPSDRLAGVCGSVLAWAAPRLPAERTLALFLVLYNCGAFGSRLTRSSLLRSLLQRSDAYDLRGVNPSTAVLFAQAVMCREALRLSGLHPSLRGARQLQQQQQASSRPQSGGGLQAARSAVFLTGGSLARGGLTVARAELRCAFAEDLTPPVQPEESDAGLLLPRERMAGWWRLEQARLSVARGVSPPAVAADGAQDAAAGVSSTAATAAQSSPHAIDVGSRATPSSRGSGSSTARMTRVHVKI